MTSAVHGLGSILATLTSAARQRGLSDSAWARLAHLPKESLSRLRRRNDCDWSTLIRLATAVGMQLRPSPADGLFPLSWNRDEEERLYRLVRSGNLDPAIWRLHGPSFFMAGVAVLLAGARGCDRERLLRLAEALHVGISEPAVANIWMRHTPIEPSRFFAQLEGSRRDVA